MGHLRKEAAPRGRPRSMGETALEGGTDAARMVAKVDVEGNVGRDVFHSRIFLFLEDLDEEWRMDAGVWGGNVRTVVGAVVKFKHPCGVVASIVRRGWAEPLVQVGEVTRTGMHGRRNKEAPLPIGYMDSIVAQTDQQMQCIKLIFDHVTKRPRS